MKHFDDDMMNIRFIKENLFFLIKIDIFDITMGEIIENDGDII
jgi:hypothetical protein